MNLQRLTPSHFAIIGAGFAGSVAAERLASAAGQHVLLIDQRPHIGGNAYENSMPTAYSSTTSTARLSAIQHNKKETLNVDASQYPN